MARQFTGFGRPGSSPSANNAFNKNAASNTPGGKGGKLWRGLKGLFGSLMSSVGLCALLAGGGYEVIKANDQLNEMNGKWLMSDFLSDTFLEPVGKIDVGILAVGNTVVDGFKVAGAILDYGSEMKARVQGKDYYPASDVIPVCIKEELILRGWDVPNSEMAQHRKDAQEQIFRMARRYSYDPHPIKIYVRTPEEASAWGGSLIDVWDSNSSAASRKCGKDDAGHINDSTPYSQRYVTRGESPRMTLGRN